MYRLIYDNNINIHPRALLSIFNTNLHQWSWKSQMLNIDVIDRQSLFASVCRRYSLMLVVVPPCCVKKALGLELHMPKRTRSWSKWNERREASFYLKAIFLFSCSSYWNGSIIGKISFNGSFQFEKRKVKCIELMK